MSNKKEDAAVIPAGATNMEETVTDITATELAESAKDEIGSNDGEALSFPNKFLRAIEKLELEGQPVTTRNVRRAIGSGSFSTIGQLLRKRNRMINLSELSQSMPENFSIEILKLGKDMYDYLQKSANKERIRLQNEFDQMSSDVESHCEELELKLEESQEVRQRLEDENSTLKKQLEEERNLNHSLQTQLLKQIKNLKAE